jgi:hypothetical protein
LDEACSVFGEVAYEVGRLGREVRDEDVESEVLLLAGEELPHAVLGWLGEVIPVDLREACLVEQLGEPAGRDKVVVLGHRGPWDG